MLYPRSIVPVSDDNISFSLAVHDSFAGAVYLFANNTGRWEYHSLTNIIPADTSLKMALNLQKEIILAYTNYHSGIMQISNISCNNIHGSEDRNCDNNDAVDNDHDGFASNALFFPDCDDNNPAVFPLDNDHDYILQLGMCGNDSNDNDISIPNPCFSQTCSELGFCVSIQQTASCICDNNYHPTDNIDCSVNQNPVITISDITVDENTPVLLDASSTIDNDGDDLHYHWMQISGDEIQTIGDDAAWLSFQAPDITNILNDTVSFELTVTDNFGGTAKKIITITVNNINDAPVADAGIDQTVDEDSLIILDASGSLDPDDDNIDYHWEQLSGIPVTLNDGDTRFASFHSFSLSTNSQEILVFELTVSDENGAKDTDLIYIAIRNINENPIIDSFQDYITNEGDPVFLTVTAHDPDGDILYYQWNQVSGSMVVLNNNKVSNPVFTAPFNAANVPLHLAFEIIVSDDFGGFDIDTVEVQIFNINESPVVVTESSLYRNAQEIVYLDAASSYDPDGDTITFFWEQIDGDSVILASIETSSTSFTAPVLHGFDPDIYRFLVTVSDPLGKSASSTVSVQIGIDSDNDGYASNNSGGDDCNDLDTNIHPNIYDPTAEECIQSDLAWTSQTVDSDDNTGKYSSIYYDDNNNRIHVSYKNESYNLLKYALFENNIWSISTIDTSSTVGTGTSLKIDSSGTIHISYQADESGHLYYTRNSTGTWQTAVIDNGDSVGSYSTLAVDSHNAIHITYCDEVLQALKYASNKTGQWIISSIDSENVGRFSSLTIDNSDVLHLAYQDEMDMNLKYARNSTGTWQLYNVEEPGNTGFSPSIAVNSFGDIYIAYYDFLFGDLKIAYLDHLNVQNSNIIFDVSVIDNIGNVGQYPSLRIDSKNNLHIIYSQFNGIIKYAKYSNSTWNISTIDSELNTGNNFSLALNEFDEPISSFFDMVNAHLAMNQQREQCISYGSIADLNCDGVDGIDNDRDGFVKNAAFNSDCNDSDNTIYPGAVDNPSDGVDYNCDGND